MDKKLWCVAATVLMLSAVLAGCRTGDAPAAETGDTGTTGPSVQQSEAIEATEGLVEKGDGVGVWYGDASYEDKSDANVEDKPDNSTASTENSDKAPADSDQTDENTVSQNTQPDQVPEDTGADEETAPQPDDNTEDSLVSAYEAYLAMTPEQQQSYFEQFESVDTFFAWFHAAKEAYDISRDTIEIDGDASVDIGDLINGNQDS